MTKIKKLADEISEELDSAKEYAENHLMYKAKGNDEWSKHFFEMANDELKHADYLHDLAVEEIDELRKVYTPPQDMLDKWESDHKKFIEKTAWIKQMLAMQVIAMDIEQILTDNLITAIEAMFETDSFDKAIQCEFEELIEKGAV